MRLTLPLHALVLPPEFAPINADHLAALVDGERVDTRPIEVDTSWCGGHFVITRGRHRFLHALTTGATELAAVGTW